MNQLRKSIFSRKVINFFLAIFQSDQFPDLFQDAIVATSQRELYVRGDRQPCSQDALHWPPGLPKCNEVAGVE